MGALPLWLWLVGKLPPRAVDVLNAAGRGPLGRVAKRLGGVAPERAIPVLARDRAGARPVPPGRGGGALPSGLREGALPPGRSARSALSRGQDRRFGAESGHIRPESHPNGDLASAASEGRVLLWTDTFSSAFDPAVVRAATAVLTALGYAVELPPRTVCCGLTWTSTGQVATARRVLGRSLAAVEPWLTAGVPVVGLEPSCTAALRADAAELLPDHPLVPRLATGVRTFAELLAEHADALRAAVVAPGGRALVQVHCHQHAELGTEADRAVMAALGVDAEVLDSGCCGLAGNFGFEKGHYAVSMACAERVLLPAVRAADPDVAVLADGFSCRTQLRQAGTREPVHLAQLAATALGLPT
jgi:Fe-S oxidoreductase